MRRLRARIQEIKNREIRNNEYFVHIKNERKLREKEREIERERGFIVRFILPSTWNIIRLRSLWWKKAPINIKRENSLEERSDASCDEKILKKVYNIEIKVSCSAFI